MIRIVVANIFNAEWPDLEKDAGLFLVQDLRFAGLKIKLFFTAAAMLFLAQKPGISKPF